MPRIAPRLHQVRVADLPALRVRVSELGTEDPRCTERLLGQLAALESSSADRDAAEMVFFVPMRGCRALADRAVEELNGATRSAQGRWIRRAPGPERNRFF
jgi:hypothetical protein